MNQSQIHILYEQYKNGIFRYAFSILKDTHMAEDALQEAFLRLLSGSNTVEIGREQAWLYRVTRNYCYDQLRKQKRERQPSQPPGQESPYRYIEMISGLKPKDQEIVTLRIVDGMGFRDIGKVMGMTEYGVQKRWQRAMKQLREQEDNYGK